MVNKDYHRKLTFVHQSFSHCLRDRNSRKESCRKFRFSGKNPLAHQ